jgi:hypothetical protein
MKQKSILLIAIFVLSIFSVESFGQAKKPRLVVVPSDALLVQMNLLGGTDDMGEVNYVQNYKQAFLDTDLKACIAKISELFQDDGFPLTMLEAELRRVQGKNLTIPVDVRLELNYKINKQGPRDVLYYELTGLDAYSSKQIAGSSGQSNPAIGETKVNLLQEAVKDKFRKFADDILNYFTSLAEVGRESRLTIETNGIELPSQVEDIVDLWLQRNCVNGSFSIDEVDEEALRASQAMMPLFNANGRGMDARNFYRPLVQELKTKLPGYTVTQKTSSKTSQSDGGGTLGDAYILISQ